MQTILGTSMWGWTISKTTAFQLLDFFYANGQRQVDTATNYPINKNSADWRKSENILAEWLNAHGIADMKIWSKVGSLDNQMSPHHNLTPSFLYLAQDYYQNLFKSNLHTIGIHWDNRTDQKAIEATFTALSKINKDGLHIGCSGVQQPELYVAINKNYDLKFRIQLKNNLLQSDYHRYAPFHNNGSEWIAYGINAGGLKLATNRYRTQSYLKTRGGDPLQIHPIIPKIQTILAQTNQHIDRPPLITFHEVSLLYNYYQKGINGVLLGASSKEQLENSLEFINRLKQVNYRDVYKNILNHL